MLPQLAIPSSRISAATTADVILVGCLGDWLRLCVTAGVEGADHERGVRPRPDHVDGGALLDLRAATGMHRQTGLFELPGTATTGCLLDQACF
eukprot:COSAG04_NODE_891_length_9607_cov_13.087085_5_plen_93_part_00